jgi:DNA-directed RNA polymerase specialized sigma24 family protein
MPFDLDSASLQALLDALEDHAADQGLAYERLRSRLIRFFTWNRCTEPEDLADTALDRLARKIASGEPVIDPQRLITGIAHMLLHEQTAREIRERKMLSRLRWWLKQPITSDETLRSREEALAHCLERMPGESRSLLERYYTGDAGARIRQRQQLASELGIALNALRNRALRLRTQLDTCTSAYLSEGPKRDRSRPAITKKNGQ